MAISESQNYIVFPTDPRGPYEGEISPIMQGDTGSRYRIFARYPDGSNFDFSGNPSGHYWKKYVPGTAYDVTGTIARDATDHSLLLWDVSAQDTGTEGDFYLIFTDPDGRKSTPVLWNVRKDPGSAGGSTPPEVSYLPLSRANQDLQANARTITGSNSLTTTIQSGDNAGIADIGPTESMIAYEDRSTDPAAEARVAAGTTGARLFAMDSDENENEIRVGDSSMTVTSHNGRGLENDADYSGTAVPRSLIDLAHTNSLISAAIGALSAVASSGDYNDLTNKPTIPVNLNDLSDVTSTGAALDAAIAKLVNVSYSSSGWVFDLSSLSAADRDVVEMKNNGATFAKFDNTSGPHRYQTGVDSSGNFVLISEASGAGVVDLLMSSIGVLTSRATQAQAGDPSEHILEANGPISVRLYDSETAITWIFGTDEDGYFYIKNPDVESGVYLLWIDDGGEVYLEDKVRVNGSRFMNFKENQAVANSGTSYQFDCNSTLNHRITVNDNVTFSVTNTPTTNTIVTLSVDIIQDGTGGHSITWWSGIRWAGGTAPTGSTAAGTKHHYLFRYNGAEWYGYVGGEAWA